MNGNYEMAEAWMCRLVVCVARPETPLVARPEKSRVTRHEMSPGSGLATACLITGSPGCNGAKESM